MGLKAWLITTFLLLYPSATFCDDCNFNLPYRGLSCNLDLSHKNLSNIKKLLNNSDKFVALTFDDGPSSNRVNNIINILENYKAKATFFLLGERINKKTSEIVKKIYNAGHELGNHSWSHKKLTSLSSEKQLQELEKTNMVIKNAIERDVKWFRSPYGCHDDNLIKNTNQLNMCSILWTVDSLDWQGDKPEILVDRVVGNVHNGAIILFHDHDNKSNTVEALPQIIKILKKLGYEFVTLSEWEERVCKAKGVSMGEGVFKKILCG
ncbi:polysaccharide deacetylase family protein [Wolbachia endosymbiont of Brugia malayi]|uniref:polysaccharide deacetylase family protein n=1 Tax=unclassified Wolbachia TaxID=2640676 RepID=UPI00004C925B|nr:Predicted xylanase/chitin deacetylase [Wolbachia endosymbiont strain TRS of Brugia malayi]QCB62069.1 polysaccharide deacetylase family protein [Wolbachia endosymbiont of Brugia malayi]QIT36473.1 polysaccharide deacetylase family protein [Wolbachia endosymbiont of Brugia pahangi]